MRVLVTGGAGFIGSHVCDELLSMGAEVVSIDCLDAQVHPSGRWPDYHEHENLTKVQGDITDYNSLEVVMALGPYDAVIHLAA